jgi:circadian clock protein KaiB
MKYVLKLYVTGRSANSERAVENLKKILNEPSLDGKYELEIIDVLKHPELAEDDKIVATPILIKSLPPPLSKIIGDLNNKEKLRLGLCLIESDQELTK